MNQASPRTVDVLILGAGAAGLFCGARMAGKGLKILVLDHAAKPAEKVRISGGGRCNFTNLHTQASNFISANPHFAKSALARYTPWDFCDLMASHGLSWHEKTLGQLFCDQKSGAIIQMLLDELAAAGGALALRTEIGEVRHADDQFHISTNEGEVVARNLVVATGGLSIPKMRASGLAYNIARQFGHTVITPTPALVPFTFTDALHDTFAALSGVSAGVAVKTQRGPEFIENMLFTHRGLSGPAMLQASSYWHPGEAISVNLVPGRRLDEDLREARAVMPRKTPATYLADTLPARLSETLATLFSLPFETPLAQLSNADIDLISLQLSSWALRPAGTEGWRTAEVTSGGVDTTNLSSKTMESQRVSGLYFIGECVDVTGWLGGYNFQWAWASANAAAQTIK